MKTLAIIQARMGSTRLPGKVMKDLSGESVLARVIRRVKACPLVSDVVVATTVSPPDSVICDEATKHGAKVFRGSERDVLSRYHFAAQQEGGDVLIRVTSDCPLFDPEILDEMLQVFTRARSLDYLSNTLERRTFPRGLDAEVFAPEVLANAHEHATAAYQREHVTPYIYQNPHIFSLQPYFGAEDLSHHRWTLDTEEDLRLIRAIYAALADEQEFFPTRSVVEFLGQRPDLVRLNAHIQQKELDLSDGAARE